MDCRSATARDDNGRCAGPSIGSPRGLHGQKPARGRRRAAAQGFSKTQEARFARGDLDAEETGISFHLVRPGKRQAFAHRHHRAEEVYVVTSGTGRVKVDDEVVKIGPMDAVRVSPATARAFEAGPEGLEFLAFGPYHERDGEVVSDFWED